MNKPGVIYEPTKSQSIAINEFLKGDYLAIAFVAGFGAGKSWVLTIIMIIMKLRYPKCDLLYLTPVFSNFRDILIPTIDEILADSNIGYKINKTTGEIAFHKGGRIIIKSMDDPSKIIGFNVLHTFLDEYDTLPTNKANDVWNKAAPRNRQKAHKVTQEGEKLYKEDGTPIYETNQMFVATTPEGFRATYQKFKKNKPDNYLLIQASTEENTHLPEHYIPMLMQTYNNSPLVEGYLKGQFVNLTSGTVFSDFDRDTCNSSETYRRGEPLHVGVDFNVLGINAVFYVKRPSLIDQDKEIPNYNYNNKETLICIDHFQKVQDTPQLITLLREKYPMSNIIIYPDASGANTSTKGATLSDISMLKQAHFRCLHPRKNPNIMDRVLSANSAFKNGLVKVNVSRCSDFAEALEQQIYNEKTEMPEKNAGANTIDDATDAGTYILHYLFPIKRKTFRSIDTKEV